MNYINFNMKGIEKTESAKMNHTEKVIILKATFALQLRKLIC